MSDSITHADSMTFRKRRAIAAAVGLTLGAGALVATADSAHAINALSARDTRVFVEGDSLTVGARPYLRRSARGHVRTMTIDAQVGRTTSTGIRMLKRGPARVANVWVVALGTNDAPSAAVTRRNVMRVMSMAKQRRVIWVNVVRPGGYQRVNATLAALSRRFANLTVVDWAAVIRKNRSLLRGDRVHLTAGGYRVRANVITRAVAAL